MSQPSGYWLFSAAEQDQAHELSYFPSDDHHPEITIRCGRYSGVATLEFSVNRMSDLETVQVGATSLSLPAVYDDDPHWDVDVATVTIPANHVLFFHLERGEPVVVGSSTYPQVSDTDRTHARAFVRACNGHAFEQVSNGQERTWVVVVASYPASIDGLRAAREHIGRIEESVACAEIWRAAPSGLHAVVLGRPLSRIDASSAAAEARTQGSRGAYAARANDWTRVRSGVC